MDEVEAIVREGQPFEHVALHKGEILCTGRRAARFGRWRVEIEANDVGFWEDRAHLDGPATGATGDIKDLAGLTHGCGIVAFEGIA